MSGTLPRRDCRVRLALWFASVVLLAGCGQDANVSLAAGQGAEEPPSPQPSPPPSPPPAAPPVGDAAPQAPARVPLRIDVSSQHPDRDPVRLVVHLDGTLVVDQAFPWETGHHWRFFPLEVEPGEHELVAEAPEWGERQAWTIIVDAQRYVTLSYWGGRTGDGIAFSMGVSDEEPGYL